MCKQKYAEVCKKRGYVLEENKTHLIVTQEASEDVLCVEWSEAPTPEQLEWFLTGYTRGQGNTLSILGSALSISKKEWRLPQ